MLARVAERIYWLSRYVERVENTARLASVHSHLMFDLPKSLKLSWYSVIEITSSEDYFDEHYDIRSEKNCMMMLLADENNPGSLFSSLKMARENMRTTRDILPREAWLHINELYILVKQQRSDFETRRKRQALLQQIIKQCQAWSGMLHSILGLNNHAHSFIKLGMYLERADMTSRLLDEGGIFASQVVSAEDDYTSDGILWGNLLKSLGGYFMYRQQSQAIVSSRKVIYFLVKDIGFARSIKFCVSKVEQSANEHPHSEKLKQVLDQLHQLIDEPAKFDPGSEELHQWLDEIQQKIASAHNQFYLEWFNPQTIKH